MYGLRKVAARMDLQADLGQIERVRRYGSRNGTQRSNQALLQTLMHIQHTADAIIG